MRSPTPVALRLVIALVAALASHQALAAGVVGTGTPASCTQAALNTALVGGGTVSFNCGGTVTIPISSTKSITTSTTIDGSGQQITLDGGGTTRLFEVPNWVGQAVTLRLRVLTLRNGRAADSGAAVRLHGQPTDLPAVLEAEDVTFLNNTAAQAGADVGGGAIYTASGTNLSPGTPNQLILRRCLFQGNRGGNGGAIGMIGAHFTIEDTRFISNATHARSGGAGGHGGAIYIDGSSRGTLVLRRVTFTGNQAADLGGAIHTWMYGLPSGMTIEDSVFNSNTSGSNGGGIFHMNGRLDIARSSFHNNSAFAQGGGLWVLADGGRPGDTPVTITNSTFYQNQASGCSVANDCWAIGGGIANSGASSLALSHVTVVGNHAGWTGGGIVSGPSGVTVRASIFANNTAANGGNPWKIDYNCSNPLPDGGFNMEWIDPATGSSDYSCGFTTANPNLGALIDPGTSGATLPPQPGSPAINRVTSGCPPPSTDQRNAPRPQGSACDTGAHEVIASTDVWVELSQTGGSATVGSPYAYAVRVGNAGPLANGAVNVAVTFPAEAGSPNWTCAAAGGATCPSSGSGHISATVNLPVGGTALFASSGTWGSLGSKRHLVASATLSTALADSVPKNNSASFTTPVAHASRYYSVTPCRLVDTRNATGSRGGPALVAGQARTFPLAGTCAIPSSAWALSANVTAVSPTATGYLSLYPGGVPAPGTSTVNFKAGGTRANSATLALNPAGEISAFATHGVHLIIDASGYYQ